MTRFAATIGFFDGVHRGHRFLIECLRQEASTRGLSSMVITFARHPREVLCPDWKPQLLSTPEEKEALLRSTGVDRIEVLPFDNAMAQLSARDFMQDVLHQELGVKLLLTGYDNHFGHRERNARQAEGFADYQRYGREMGIEVIGGEPLSEGGLRFSSSLVRRLLSAGDVEKAHDCLGYAYRLSGHVVHGRQIGRQIGFPTANIRLDNPDKLVPLQGVYAVAVSLPESQTAPLPGVMNIGSRPTFGGHHVTLEAHIPGFQGDLYGQPIAVDFLHRLRDERHFDTAEALISQMHDDIALARALN